MSERKLGTLIFRSKDLIPVLLEAKKNDCSIHLVKDHGVYLLSNRGERNEKGSCIHIAYAQGCNPNIDAFYYENSVEIMGGDDSVDTFYHLQSYYDEMIKQESNLKIHVYQDHYKIDID